MIELEQYIALLFHLFYFTLLEGETSEEHLKIFGMDIARQAEQGTPSGIANKTLINETTQPTISNQVRRERERG